MCLLSFSPMWERMALLPGFVSHGNWIYELITKSGSSRMSCDAVVKLCFLPKPPITIYLLASGMKWTLNSYLNKVGVDIVCKALYSALPQVFRKDELQKMLSLFRDTSLALLGSNLDPLGYDMTQKSWYHNTRSVLNRANVHNSLPRSYLSAQTFACHEQQGFWSRISQFLGLVTYHFLVEIFSS